MNLDAPFLGPLSLESTIAVLLAAAVLVYLLYSLLRPERF